MRPRMFSSNSFQTIFLNLFDSQERIINPIEYRLLKVMSLEEYI